MQSIYPNSQSSLAPIPSASVSNINLEETVKSIVLTALFSVRKKSTSTLDKTLPHCSWIVLSYLPQIAPINSKEDLNEIRAFFQKFTTGETGNYGIFKIQNNNILIPTRLRKYLMINQKKPPSEYTKEVYALKGPKEIKEEHSLFSLRELTPEDFSNADEEHKNSSQVVYTTKNLRNSFRKRLTISKRFENPKPLLFPLEALSKIVKENITGLRTESCQICYLPEELFLLPLKELDLSNNRLRSLPPQIGNCRNLEVLNLENPDFPDSFKDLLEPDELAKRLSQNNLLRSLPQEIGLLANLKELHLKNNKLQSLPDKIGELKKLKILDLNNNNLALIPPEIGHLKSLTGLHLGDNDIQSLPDEIGELPLLQALSLHNNQLSSLQKIKNLPKLKILSVTGNNIKSLSPIASLKQLKILYLSRSMETLLLEDIRKVLDSRNVQIIFEDEKNS